MTISIHPSGSDSLRTILEWLRLEDENGGDGFWCNKDIIRQAHEAGALTVLVENDDVVAFYRKSGDRCRHRLQTA